MGFDPHAPHSLREKLEDFGCLFTRDMLVIMSPKKYSSALMRLLCLVVMAVITTIFMCLVCLKQFGVLGEANLTTIQRVEGHCYGSDLPQSEVSYVHYPEPTTYSRKECMGTPVQYFAILSMQRSGSGWFETLLNNHTDISSNGEIFSVKERRRNISTITGTLDKLYNLDWYSSASKNECTAAVGFKWMLNQNYAMDQNISPEEKPRLVQGKCPDSVFDAAPMMLISDYHSPRYTGIGGVPEIGIATVGLSAMFSRQGEGLMQNHEEIVKYFNQRGVSAVFLFRRNLLRRLVSILANMHDHYTKQLNGTHKAHVHSRNEADLLARYKPKINITSLIPDLEHTDKWTSDALEYFKSTRHTILYYEDLVSNRTKLLDVLDFLRVPRRELTSRQVKIHTKPLSDQIENWEAVYNTLLRTQYESFLQAD